MPAPTPPTTIFAKLDVEQRDHAAQRGQAVVHRVHRTARGGGGDNGEQGGGGDAEAHLLALHVAAGNAELMQQAGVAGGLPCPVGRR